ncbi:hypothetical protein IWQ60_005964 [Tieghemiomyces parasiticus]|uniref:FAD-binding FR-type domain-containing protein n=1 Tax=Tieghemiomyces parasiticus TaxID=78921 RepID=A0A9W8DSL4_9FUNG|nr:hypothetical protein IWQ60_005964 [Tieghemiomyces parasiticus]
MRYTNRLGQVVLAGGLLGYGYYGLYLPWADPRNVPNTLDPHYFRPFTLRSRRDLTHDTALLQFDHQPTAALPIDQPGIYSVDVKDPTMQVKRSFTPIVSRWFETNRDDNPTTPAGPNAMWTNDRLEILVKRYPLASVAQMLHRTRKGATAEIRGPFLEWAYTPNRYTHLALIAGGTGITPMYQLIEQVLGNPEDRTHLTLVYANRTVSDVALREQIEQLQARYTDRLSVQFTVDQSPANERTGLELAKGGPGYVFGYLTKDVLAQRLPSARPTDKIRTMVLVSGPDAMMSAVCGERLLSGEQGPVSGILRELGYTSEQVYKL